MTAQGVNVARKSDKKATGSQVMNSDTQRTDTNDTFSSSS
jgi:hypothetical protein